MILALLAAAATAAPPTGAVSAVGQASALGRPAWEHAGLGLHGGLALQERLDLELGVEAGASGSGGVFGAARLGWRLYAAGPARPRISTTLAYGVAAAGSLRPTGLAGLALDLGATPDRAWRVQGAAVSDGLRLAGAQLSVGRAFGGRPAPAAPTPVLAAEEPVAPAAVAPTAAPAPPPPAAVSPAGARVWLPHPWCRWMPVVDGALEIPGDLAGAPAWASAAGHRPAGLQLQPGGAIALEPVQEQGSLVVVAQPGDRVLRGEVELAISPDGVAVVRAPSGRIDVVVEGGGRRQALAAAVSDGHVTWARAAAAEEERVRFASGSAKVAPDGRAALEALAAAAGGWRFGVQGGASPDGDAARNAELAVRRAVACGEVLRSAGLSESQVEISAEPRVAPADTPAAELPRWRSCIVTPLPPSEDP